MSRVVNPRCRAASRRSTCPGIWPMPTATATVANPARGARTPEPAARNPSTYRRRPHAAAAAWAERITRTAAASMNRTCDMSSTTAEVDAPDWISRAGGVD